MKLEKSTKQIIFTAFLLLAVILIFQFTDFDIEFQSIFYNFETKSWILSKDNYLADLIFWPPLHKGTKCDMRFKSSLNSARLNLLNPYK